MGSEHPSMNSTERRMSHRQQMRARPYPSRSTAPNEWLRSPAPFLNRVILEQCGARPHFLLDPNIPWSRRNALELHREEAVELIGKVRVAFGLSAVTAGLGVHYLDMYIQKRSFMPKEAYGIIAAVSLMLSAKMWENKSPSIDQLCQLLGRGVSAAEVRECEMDVLQSLGWELNAIAPHSFVHILVSACGLAHEAHFNLAWANDLVDLSSFECKTLAFPQAVVAAAAVLFAWPPHAFEQATETYLPRLADICMVPPATIKQCMTVLMDRYRKEHARGAQQDALKPQSASSEPKSPQGRESPDSTMASLADAASSSPALRHFDSLVCSQVPKAKALARPPALSPLPNREPLRGCASAPAQLAVPVRTAALP